MLSKEYATASNIRSRVNRQSVMAAITSAQQRLKQYHEVPRNGLILYSGTVVIEGGEEKIIIDFEPFLPISASLYLCDNRFHTEALHEILESDDKFGFIVMDGNGTLFGTLSGTNTREILYKFSVDLPRKHGRGGQSALRFARLREEKRHNYVRKTAELSRQLFINPNTNEPVVAGLILAGSADLKSELSQSSIFDRRLQAKVLSVVDLSYGGENGFNKAIELSADRLSNVKFTQERQLLQKYFEEINQSTGRYAFGVDDTLKALAVGAVRTLIVWENLDIKRYTMRNSVSGEVIIKHLNMDQEADKSNFQDSATDAELEVQDKASLLEWLTEEYRNFGCTLKFVTNRSGEGSQFCNGFGGIGGILRYQLDIRSLDEPPDEDGLYEEEE